MEAFDNDVHEYLNREDEEIECTECFNLVDEEKTQCSPECRELYFNR